MTGEHARHQACVDLWMGVATKQVPSAQLIRRFERTIEALWRRAHVTLGDVTLAAIVDRVLYTAAARFPSLAALEVEPSGVRFEALKRQAEGLNQDELVHGIRFALVEFLTVLGHLTAEILTPALHSELSRLTLDDMDRPEPAAPALNALAAKKVGGRA